MEIYFYKLKFKGPVHFGETGIELENVTERVCSDTFFSSLINTMSVVYGKIETDRFVERFFNNPPFKISSLFLYNKDTIYLPRPLFDDQLSQDLKKKLGKELKKSAWLSQKMFLKWISGKEFSENDVDNMVRDQESYKQSYVVEIRPRVTLDRNSQNSALYHSGYVHFDKDAGLCGFVAIKEKPTVNIFKNLLENLGSIGLGGEKTYGAGMFEVVGFSKCEGALHDIFHTHSPWYVTLSLYHPSPQEMASIGHSALAYDLIRRKGWITSGRTSLPLKRKSVGFFVEGSVFKEKVKGCVVDVTPDTDPNMLLKHRVFRYGYALTAPFGG